MKLFKNVSLIILTIIFFKCTSPTTNNIVDSCKKPEINSVNTSLGVPKDNDTTNDYYIIRHQYVLSYNKNLNICNWVSWELNASWFGDVKRYSGNFFRDTLLPIGFYRVKHSDYTNSGYDRGHVVMSKERTATIEDNRSTFFLTNVIPQRPDLNRGVWLDFENYCNNLCLKENKELFIIAGGFAYTDSTLSNKGIVYIPDSCFKIVVILESGEGLKDVTTNTNVIAVAMPNIDGIRSDKWEKYKTTINNIENSTGYDFLNCVPISIQNVIKKK